MLTFGPWARARGVLVYNDNEAALRALQKGYSPNRFMALVIAEFWHRASEYDWHV